MKTLVTGGAGFIGSHLVDRLVADGHEVVVLDNFLRGNKLDRETVTRIELIEGDVRDETAVLEASRGCEVVYHLAAVLGVDVVADSPVETMETEAAGLRNVARAAIKHRTAKVVYASTSGVYTKSSMEESLQEEFHVSPKTSYAVAKRYNEIYLKALLQEKNLASVSVRYFNIYGPRQDARMVIPRFFEQARQGEPITVFGSGDQTRDFTFVSDAVEATVRAAGMVGGAEILNIATGREYTILQLAERIVALTDSSSEIRKLTPPQGRYDYEVERRLGSAEKLRRLTGYAPATSLDDGLRQTWAWMQEER